MKQYYVKHFVKMLFLCYKKQTKIINNKKIDIKYIIKCIFLLFLFFNKQNDKIQNIYI